MMEQYIWPATILIMFIGMWALVWRSLGIAHDLAKMGMGGMVPTTHPQPAPSVLGGLMAKITPTAAPAPKPLVTPTAPISTQPADVVDQGLVNFIKKAEGFVPKAFWDYKQYSIGYGTKANSATEVIDEAEAEARLTVEIDKALKLVQPILPAGTPIGIQQALVDLTYNAGSGWESQGLGTAVKAADWPSVKSHILLYNHAGGVVNAGLTKRRETEVSWFDNPL